MRLPRDEQAARYMREAPGSQARGPVRCPDCGEVVAVCECPEVSERVQPEMATIDDTPDAGGGGR